MEGGCWEAPLGSGAPAPSLAQREGGRGLGWAGRFPRALQTQSCYQTCPYLVLSLRGPLSHCSPHDEEQ